MVLLCEIIWFGYMLVLWVEYCKKNKGIPKKPGEQAVLFGKTFVVLLNTIVMGITYLPTTVELGLPLEIKEGWKNIARMIALLYVLILLIVFNQEEKEKEEEEKEEK